MFPRIKRGGSRAHPHEYLVIVEAYREDGKPKHPYLGKVCVLLVDVSELSKLSPYFVVYAHANGRVKISTHFSNNILSEREVCFPGFVPGRCVLYEKVVRLPSFVGSYKAYYKEKYGITERSFKIIQGKLLKEPDKSDPETRRKRMVTVNNLIQKVILHTAKALQEHIEKECSKNKITIVYKGLTDGFVGKLPDINDVLSKK